jgi:prolipoprotein diacylglyceryltransferase
MSLPFLHPLFEVLAFVVGFQLYRWLRRRRGDAFTEERRWVLIAAAAGGALVGSRLLAALEHPALFADPPHWLYYYANKTIVGGLLGGTLAVEIVKAFLGERRRSGDLFTYPLIAAIAVGRVGCQLAGVADGTAGLPSSLPWAMNLGDGVPRHPTALYEILFLIVLGVTLHRMERRSWPFTGFPALTGGRLYALFLLLYLLWRLAIETLKPVEPLALGASAIQWAAALGALYCCGTLWRLRRWRDSAPTPTTT